VGRLARSARELSRGEPPILAHPAEDRALAALRRGKSSIRIQPRRVLREAAMNAASASLRSASGLPK
jgi:hypothetical protein